LPFARQTFPNGVSVGAYLLASFAAYAVGSVMVYGFGIGVAVERGMKMDLLMRATPLPPGIAILAKVFNALVFSLLSVVVLIVYGIIVGGVRQDLTVWINIVVRLLAGSLPFIALGFAIGYSSGPGAAPALANLIYLPLAFAPRLMPSDALAFRELAYVFVAAVLGGGLAWAARQPLILGYVFGGLLISPFTPGPALSDVHTFEVIAEVGVILLMYSVGMEFSLR